jgi:Flp pilus assembly secretin CpaC
MSSRMMLSIALLFVTQVVVGAEPETSVTDQQQLLQQKVVELDQLQADITKLREATGTPVQIRVDFQMLEVNLTKLRERGIDTDWFAKGYLNESEIQEVVDGTKLFSGDDLKSKQDNHGQAFINRLQQENFAKTLADPSLVVVSGQPASFHVGGEFPIPTGANAGVGFRKVGTELIVTALALGDNQVRLEYVTRVSSIEQNHVVDIDGKQIPALQVRQLDSGCQLSFGQTVIMAGLVQKSVEAQEGPNGEAVEKSVDVGLMLVITPELLEHTEKKAGNAGKSFREAFPVAQR